MATMTTQQTHPCDWDPKPHYYFGKSGYRCQVCTVWQPDAEVVKAVGTPASVAGCPAYVPKTPAAQQAAPAQGTHDWDPVTLFCKACGEYFASAASNVCPGSQNLGTPAIPPAQYQPGYYGIPGAAPAFNSVTGIVLDEADDWASGTNLSDLVAPVLSPRGPHGNCADCDRELAPYLDATYDLSKAGLCSRCQRSRGSKS